LPISRAAWSSLPNEMPESVSPAQSVLTALGFVLFAHDEAGGLQLLGEAPPWLTVLWPVLQEGARNLPVSEASPFLKNFLIDAEECWKKGGEERAQSGPWIEQDANGQQVELDATAMTSGGQPILLLERLGEAFEAKKAVLQHARETVIALQRLNSEVQKKQILLHSVANDLRAGLANVITSLRLIEMEKNGERTRNLLRLATRASDAQQALIERILGVFQQEMGAGGGAMESGMNDTAWEPLFRQALGAVAPLFAEKKVRLDTAAPALERLRVAGDAAQLERMMSNLLQDALERTGAGSSVVVRTKEEPESLLISVEDSGPILGTRACRNIFGQEMAGKSGAASAMRLQFCRIVVEDCGGEMSCDPLPGGGNRFSIRLTKSADGG
jgi:signal transduction histidine kinase